MIIINDNSFTKASLNNNYYHAYPAYSGAIEHV